MFQIRKVIIRLLTLLDNVFQNVRIKRRIHLKSIRERTSNYRDWNIFVIAQMSLQYAGIVSFSISRFTWDRQTPRVNERYLNIILYIILTNAQ